VTDPDTFQLDLGGYEDIRGAIVAHDCAEMLLGNEDKVNSPIEPNQTKEQYVEFLNYVCFKVVADIKAYRSTMVTLHAPEGSYQSDEEYTNLIEVLLTLRTDEKVKAVVN
jgi:hypothetical protein